MTDTKIKVLDHRKEKNATRVGDSKIRVLDHSWH